MRSPLGILPLFSNFQFPVSDFDFLAKRPSQALGGGLQLALKSFPLLRDVRQLFLGELPGLNNLMSLTVRLAHRCAYSHCHSRQPALLSHRVLLLQRHSSYIGLEMLPILSIANARWGAIGRFSFLLPCARLLPAALPRGQNSSRRSPPLSRAPRRRFSAKNRPTNFSRLWSCR